MKKISAALMAVLIMCASIIGRDAQAEDEIRAVLDVQVEAWNRRDIAGFMETYWKSPELTFQSGGSRLYGWENLLQRYKTNYAGEKMGRLSFKDLEVKVLSPDLAYALGRYHLAYPDSSREGEFTIILKRMPQGWRIIHDHSSSQN